MNKKYKEKKLKTSRISVKPYVYSIPSISSISLKILILLSLQVIMLLLSGSVSALFVILTTLSAALLAAFINYKITKEPLYNIMHTAIQGILFGLLLPETYPLVTAFVISFVTILIARTIVFKGINAWANVPAVAVVIAWYI